MSILDILGTAEGPFMTQWTAPATGLANFRCWLQAAVRTTAWLRPNYPREPTFAIELPLFWIFDGCTLRCGRSG